MTKMWVNDDRIVILYNVCGRLFQGFAGLDGAKGDAGIAGPKVNVPSICNRLSVGMRLQ